MTLRVCVFRPSNTAWVRLYLSEKKISSSFYYTCLYSHLKPPAVFDRPLAQLVIEVIHILFSLAAEVMFIYSSIKFPLQSYLIIDFPFLYLVSLSSANLQIKPIHVLCFGFLKQHQFIPD